MTKKIIVPIFYYLDNDGSMVLNYEDTEKEFYDLLNEVIRSGDYKTKFNDNEPIHESDIIRDENGDEIEQ